MMGTKKLSEIKKELISSLGYLPGESAKVSLPGQSEAAKRDVSEIEKKLEAALAELEREVKKRRKTKASWPAKR